MANVDETWAAVYPPLQELKAQPDLPWDERRAAFLGKLGLAEPAQDPVVHAFILHVEDLPDSQRDDLLRGDEAETLLYGFVEQYSDDSSAEDDSPWESFLEEKGPYWDGTEDSWAQFYEWFAYEAEQAGVGQQANDLLAELAGQDIEDRITTFGRKGVRIIRRPDAMVVGEKAAVSGKRKDRDTEPVEETEPRRSSRVKEKVAKKPKKTGPPRVTIRSAAEGVATQKLNTRQKIGFHMVATLTNPPGNVDGQFEFRQYARDEFDKLSGAIPMTAYDEDGPFAPPYEDSDGEEDVNVTIGDESITFDDHPGFSTGNAIAVGDWLNSYTVEFYWTVTRKADGAVWTSPNTVTHEVTSEYDTGNDADVDYNVGGDENWVVVFPAADSDSDSGSD